jgi:uncharacterized protein (DUF2147 family)
MKKILCFLLITFITPHAFADGPDDILGIWSNGTEKGHIQIFKQNGKYYGKLIWLMQPNDERGLPKVDKNNPDAALRSKPLMGLIMLRDFKYDDGEWKGGKIYNPHDGNEYRAFMKLKDIKTLDVRGYIGFALFGKTETFHRVK